MEDKDLLQLCLNITGAFENGAPKFDAVTGNFDGQGLSVGILQWCAGQGSLQTLLQNIANRMGWDRAQSFFVSDIHHLAILRPTEAVQFCLDHYIQTGTTNVDPSAVVRWQTFLSQPESIAAQTELATTTVLYRAKTLAQQFCGFDGFETRTRTLSFFFDLVTQSGGMENKRGHVDPLTSSGVDVTDVLNFTQVSHAKCAGMWELAVQNDPLAQVLLHYAYQRSLLSNPLYVWDALSRRGAIACRSGIVHSKTVSFTDVLD